MDDVEEEVEASKREASASSANGSFVPELFVTKSKKDTLNTVRQNKLR